MTQIDIQQEHTNREVPDLSTLGNVSAEYKHRQKLISPGPGLALPDAYLKWYEIRPAEKTFQPEYIEACRALLRAEVEAGNLSIERQLGFVILHHCTSVDFLIVSTWCNENELWQTAYVRNLSDDSGFELVKVGTHRPVFCVWELGAACYESGAWSRFLASARDEQAKLAYVNDMFSGLV